VAIAKDTTKEEDVMPTVDERLRHVTLKIERAKKHVSDLNSEITAFLKTYPYRVGAKHDPQTRQLVYYVVGVEVTPDSLPLIAGDAIQNLMSALDHMAYQLVCSDTGDHPPNPRWIYFPIADDAQKYEAGKRGKIKGARDETLELIDALKPYKGGNDPLWALFRLNNIEKHRLLMTVGSMLKAINVGAIMSREMQTAFDLPDSPFKGRTAPFMNVFLRPADKLFPLKVGDILLTDAIDAKPDEKMQFTFSVALYEPEIIQAQSILETIHQMTTLVEGIVTALTPRLQ
jgi:hypothetical protein